MKKLIELITKYLSLDTQEDILRSEILEAVNDRRYDDARKDDLVFREVRLSKLNLHNELQDVIKEMESEPLFTKSDMVGLIDFYRNTNMIVVDSEGFVDAFLENQ